MTPLWIVLYLVIGFSLVYSSSDRSSRVAAMALLWPLVAGFMVGYCIRELVRPARATRKK